MRLNGTVLAGIAMALTACTQQNLPPIPPKQDFSAFDGTYVGTTRLTSIAMGASDMRSICETNPRTRIQVSDGRFQFGFQLPNYPGQPRTTFAALLWPNGEFIGANERGAELRGRIADGMLSGTVTGFGCYYEIAARRS